MAQYFDLHPENPQPRLLKQAAAVLAGGGVVALPTDSSYAIACHLDDKAAADRLRQIRRIDEKYHLTLLCRDLSELANYARVDNRQYRLLKSATPGPYTFILDATREVPRRVSHPQRKTIGLRVPDHPVITALLDELGEPVLTSSLLLPGEEAPLTDAGEIRDRLGREVELVVESGTCGLEVTTVVDLTSGAPELLRAGKGSLEPFGLEA